jgi:hypothetical protein
MAHWLSDQWKQIRGHVKYEFLRAGILALAGSSIIAASGALLRKVFYGVNAEWFVFGSVLLCSLFVFIVALIGIRRKAPNGEESPSVRLKIGNVSETMKLGAFWTVPSDIYFGVTIELRDIASENEVTIDLISHCIHYAGANVRKMALRIGAGRFVLPRASVAYGDDCVSHWDFGESSFAGFFVYLIHANKFAYEATIGVFGIDAYKPLAEKEAATE